MGARIAPTKFTASPRFRRVLWDELLAAKAWQVVGVAYMSGCKGCFQEGL
jgi:hypothetical protein